MNIPRNCSSFTKTRLGDSRKNGGQKPISSRVYASISTFAGSRKNLQAQHLTKVASLEGVRETQVDYCAKKRCASVFRKRNQGQVHLLFTKQEAATLTTIVARKRSSHLHSRMGSGIGSPFSCAWREHATNSAQRNWCCRQGEPSRDQGTCGLGAPTRDHAQLCTRKGRRHAGRPSSVQHEIGRAHV